MVKTQNAQMTNSTASISVAHEKSLDLPEGGGKLFRMVPPRKQIKKLKYDNSKISDEILVDLLRRQDKEGIRVLYAKYSRLLFGVIFRIVKRKDLAENILQDTFLKIWQNIESYHASKGRFSVWAMNIGRNAAIDLVRSKNYRKELVTDGTENLSEQAHFSEIKIEHIGLKETVGKLAPKYRQLIDLLYFEGYTQSEAAEELGLPLGTVKSRVRKAFTELRILLQ